MIFNKKNPVLAAAALGGFILLSATCGQAQEDDDMDGIKLRSPIRMNLFDTGMTSTEPGKPYLLGYEKTAKGMQLRFSDGSTLETRDDCKIETLCDGTKIETLNTGTTIVRWPNGSGVVRNPDGTGAEFRPDPREPSRSGDLSPVPGTIEVLPGGVVRQTIKDEGAVLDKYPNGTIRSRPDLVKPEAKTTDKPVSKDLNVAPLNPFSRPTAVDKKSDSPKPLIPIVKPSIVR